MQQKFRSQFLVVNHESDLRAGSTMITEASTVPIFANWQYSRIGQSYRFNSCATNFQVQSHERRRTGTGPMVGINHKMLSLSLSLSVAIKKPRSCNTWHRGSRWSHRVCVTLFWSCWCSFCNIMHAWCRSNLCMLSWMFLLVTKLTDADSQGEWPLYLNCIFCSDLELLKRRGLGEISVWISMVELEVRSDGQ